MRLRALFFLLMYCTMSSGASLRIHQCEIAQSCESECSVAHESTCCSAQEKGPKEGITPSDCCSEDEIALQGGIQVVPKLLTVDVDYYWSQTSSFTDHILLSASASALFGSNSSPPLWSNRPLFILYHKIIGY